MTNWIPRHEDGRLGREKDGKTIIEKQKREQNSGKGNYGMQWMKPTPMRQLVHGQNNNNNVYVVERRGLCPAPVGHNDRLNKKKCGRNKDLMKGWTKVAVDSSPRVFILPLWIK